MGKKGEIAWNILILVAAVGAVVVLAAAPGLAVALKALDPNPRKAKLKFNRTLDALVRDGKVIHNSGRYTLTSKGTLELDRRRFEHYQFPTPKKWDGKWRVICFDIPEKNKRVRRVVHQKLVELEFYRLQDSVFVTPQPCGEFLKLAQQAFFLKKYLRGMVVTQLDDEQVLLSHFHLKR